MPKGHSNRGSRSEVIPKKGSRFGKWKFTGVYQKIKYSHTKAECVCECGTKRLVILKDLKNRKSLSCGCIFTKHGMYKHPAYKNWVGMNVRCRNKENKNYANYGGRGLRVCKRWHITNKKGFENFLEDIKNKPSNKHSIDRIDNKKGYNPENCRWATPHTQSNNRTNVTKHEKGHLFGWWQYQGNNRIAKTKTCSRYEYDVICRCGTRNWRSKTSLNLETSTKCKKCAMGLHFGKINGETYPLHEKL